MSKGVKPTLRQRTTFNVLLDSIRNGRRITWKAVMVKGGYSKKTALNVEHNLLSRGGFQRLLERIDDAPILAKIYEIVFGEDKRSSLSAADMIMKLKNRYPAQKSKIIGLFETIKSLEEENEKQE